MTGKGGPSAAATRLWHGAIARAPSQDDIIGIASPLCLAKDQADIVLAAAKAAVGGAVGGC